MVAFRLNLWTDGYAYQSAPKIIIQILVTGAQIFGKALFEAGKQAAKSAYFGTFNL